MDLSDLFRADFPGRAQDCHLGSYVRVDNDGLGDLASFSVAAMIWPTTPAKRGQGLVCRFDRARAEGFALLLDGPEGIAAVVGGGAGRLTMVATGVLLEQRRWYRVWASYDGPSRTPTAGQQAISGDASPAVVRATAVDHDLAAARSPGLYLAAAGGTPVGGHYNGKMERPRIVIPGGSRSGAPRRADAAGRRVGAGGLGLLDQHPGTDGLRSRPVPHAWHPRQHAGAGHDRVQLDRRRAELAASPEQYGAIHFHDDDIYDCGWETDFTFTIPQTLRSGSTACACGPVTPRT